MAVERGSPAGSPLPVVMYPTLATVLLAVGIIASALFCLYQVTTTRHSRKLQHEALLGLAASVSLGLGSLFLLLWTGVYV